MLARRRAGAAAEARADGRAARSATAGRGAEGPSGLVRPEPGRAPSGAGTVVAAQVLLAA